MFDKADQSIVIFVLTSILLIVLLISFIVTIIYRYQQKQNNYFKDIETLKTSYENALLLSQLEIQEQTFQNISREIHDSIGQKLTLAKLHLNTLDFVEEKITREHVSDSTAMISEAINDLTDLSRSMSSEIILSNGLIKALEFEVNQLQKSGLYKIAINISGNPVFMESATELLLFRIVQEAINNIIKHAEATAIHLHLHYNTSMLTMEITDNGKGFTVDRTNFGTGLQNIKKRAALLKGSFDINTLAGSGTELRVDIPLNEISNGI
jgi:two-component system, NarL family, sensor kinase